MAKMEMVINGYTQYVLMARSMSNINMCICYSSDRCQLYDKWMTEYVIYRAVEDPPKTEGAFKKTYYHYIIYFSLQKYYKSTALLK